jgi:TolA-binding protein
MALERRVEQLEAQGRKSGGWQPGPALSASQGTGGDGAAEGSNRPWIPSHLARVRLVPEAPAAPPLPIVARLREPTAEERERLFAEPAPGPVRPSGVEGELYQAVEWVRNGAVEKGIAGLRAFGKRHPRHPKAPFALYTAGVALQTFGETEDALGVLQQVESEYPESDEAAPALVRAAQCQMRLKNPQAAREMLSRVVERYGETQAARSARSQLADLSQSPGPRGPGAE